MALDTVDAGDPRCSRCGEGRDGTMCAECFEAFETEMVYETLRDHDDWREFPDDPTLHLNGRGATRQ